MKVQEIVFTLWTYYKHKENPWNKCDVTEKWHRQYKQEGRVWYSKKYGDFWTMCGPRVSNFLDSKFN